LSAEDYSDTVNLSRRQLYNKFGDRSFLNVTSTPVKSPITPVSIHYILYYTKIDKVQSVAYLALRGEIGLKFVMPIALNFITS